MTTASELPRRKKSSLGCLWRNSEQYVIRVQCPDNSSLTLIHHVKETCNNVLSNTCSRLGIVDEELFRLAIFKNNEYRLFQGNKCLNSIFPKWAIVTGESMSGSDTCFTIADTMIKTCNMYLRIVHYVTNFSILHPITLYYYFYQIRWDALKIQNLLSLEGYEDANFKLGFLSILATSSDQSLLNLEKALANHFPQTVLQAHTFENLVSMLAKYSLNLPELTAAEAHVNFINLSLTIPAVCSYLLRVDIIQDNKQTDWNCIASVSPNSIRIFSDRKGSWQQTIKWDVQETAEITYSKQIVSLQSFDLEKETTKLHLHNAASAKYFVRLSKEMQKFEQSCLAHSPGIVCEEQRKGSLSDMTFSCFQHQRENQHIFEKRLSCKGSKAERFFRKDTKCRNISVLKVDKQNR